MSRAGALALVVGLAVAIAAPTLRRRLIRSWPALPAAAVGFAGLAPSLPVTSTPQPLLAVAGLLGAAVVLGLAERRPRLTVAAVLGATAATLLLVPPAALGTVGDTRLTAASPDAPT